MTLSWNVLALALIGAQEQPPNPPSIPRSPISIEIRVGTPSCVVPDGAHLARRMREKCSLLDEVCANICPDGLVDEMTLAVYSRTIEPCGGCQAGAACPQSTTLPTPMPRVAKPPTTQDPEARETWPMTLREAIAIALDNSEVVRIIAMAGGGKGESAETAVSMAMERAKRDYSNGKPIVIAPLNADAAIWRFKAEVMAQVRSVEQQYWNLAQAHVQLWAADRAVSLAKEVLEREQAELQIGRGTVADVAEATQRLEQFKLDLVTRTSDIITTERQLRNLLGLPPSDNRRIIPVTPVSEARLEPDWDSSLAEMLSSQPDIAQQKVLVRIAEAQLLIARNQLLPPLSLNALYQMNGLGQQLDSVGAAMTGATLKSLMPLLTDPIETCSNGWDADSNLFLTSQAGYVFPMPALGRYPLANTRQAQYILLRSRAYYRQVVHQTTHSLARFFLEIDANYKQFQTAKRLRQASAQRLDAQRAYYEEGRITIDRFLDAISQYATAVATEAQYKTTYNISIAALEEAKGTLLAHDNIVVAERAHPRKPLPKPTVGADQASRVKARPDNQVVTASLRAEKAKEGDLPAKVNTWTFSLSIGGAKPLVIKGTITASPATPAE